jgi:hypothetical protein
MKSFWVAETTTAADTTSHFTCKQQPLRHEKNPSKADAKIEKYASSLLSNK